jgi:hypothetical protein
MKRYLLIAVTMTLAGAGCRATTAVGPGASATQPSQWLAEDATPEGAGESTDRPIVEVTATSPRQAQLQTDAVTSVIPLKPVGPPARSARRATVLNGMWVAAGIGVLAGLVSGSARDRAARSNPDASCDPLGCGGHALIDGAMLGAVGIGLGAAVASVVARF